MVVVKTKDNRHKFYKAVIAEGQALNNFIVLDIGISLVSPLTCFLSPLFLSAFLILTAFYISFHLSFLSDFSI